MAGSGLTGYGLNQFVGANRSSCRKGYDHCSAKLRLSWAYVLLPKSSLTLKDVSGLVKSRSETHSKWPVAVTAEGVAR